MITDMWGQCLVHGCENHALTFFHVLGCVVLEKVILSCIFCSPQNDCILQKPGWEKGLSLTCWRGPKSWMFIRLGSLTKLIGNHALQYIPTQISRYQATLSNQNQIKLPLALTHGKYTDLCKKICVKIITHFETDSDSESYQCILTHLNPSISSSSSSPSLQASIFSSVLS